MRNTFGKFLRILLTELKEQTGRMQAASWCQGGENSRCDGSLVTRLLTDKFNLCAVTVGSLCPHWAHDCPISGAQGSPEKEPSTIGGYDTLLFYGSKEGRQQAPPAPWGLESS